MQSIIQSASIAESLFSTSILGHILGVFLTHFSTCYHSIFLVNQPTFKMHLKTCVLLATSLAMQKFGSAAPTSDSSLLALRSATGQDLPFVVRWADGRVESRGLHQLGYGNMIRSLESNGTFPGDEDESWTKTPPHLTVRQDDDTTDGEVTVEGEGEVNSIWGSDGPVGRLAVRQDDQSTDGEVTVEGEGQVNHIDGSGGPTNDGEVTVEGQGEVNPLDGNPNAPIGRLAIRQDNDNNDGEITITGVGDPNAQDAKDLPIPSFDKRDLPDPRAGGGSSVTDGKHVNYNRVCNACGGWAQQVDNTNAFSQGICDFMSQALGAGATALGVQTHVCNLLLIDYYSHISWERLL